MADLPVIHDPLEMRAWSRARRRAGKRVGFVPTMGFLHAGHLSLVRLAAERCDEVVISIFVNPTQFNDPSDLESYPRDLEGDLAKAASAGATLAWVPDKSSMYGDGFQSWVEVRDLAEPLCGRTRPGHFRGVATVVTKLFNVVEPDVAVFGNKDYQQQLVVRRMVTDLDMGLEIVSGATIREADGLAMSSRNTNLAPAHRKQAVALVAALRKTWELYDAGERSAVALTAAAREAIESAPDARIDYVELRDANTLREIAELDGSAVLALAVFFGEVRLIDNTVLGGDDRP